MSQHIFAVELEIVKVDKGEVDVTFRFQIHGRIAQHIAKTDIGHRTVVGKQTFPGNNINALGTIELLIPCGVNLISQYRVDTEVSAVFEFHLNQRLHICLFRFLTALIEQ